MPLNNSQYDELIRKYDARQLANQRALEARTKEAYARIPQLKEIDDAIASCSVAQAKLLLDGDEDAIGRLKKQIASCRSKRDTLLQQHGFAPDYFKPVYTCPDCKDTGYIGQKRCHCFEQAAIDLIYTQSNLKNILKTENFDAFSYDYYSDTDINPATRVYRRLRQRGMLCRGATILSTTSEKAFPISISMGTQASERLFCQTV